MKLASSRRLACAAYFLLAALSSGCLVSDQLTTVTIHPDGSAYLVQIQSNVRSNLTGADADEELRRYVDEFNAQRAEEHVRITAAGGQVQESRWIRSELPFANLIVATLPNAAVLEKAFTFSDENGESVVTTRFTPDGTRRKLSFLVTLPPTQVPETVVEQSVHELRSDQANGLSEMRFAVTGGKIVSARFFTVAQDKQSALLEPKAILELLRNQRQVEALIEWELANQ